MAVNEQKEQAEQTLHAAFDRRNKENGKPEILRIMSSDYNGHVVTNVRHWYKVTPRDRDDDGLRPSKVGVTFRERELDELITALEAIRDEVHAQGRSTGNAPARSSAPHPTPPAPHQRPARSQPPATTPRHPMVYSEAARREAEPWHDVPDSTY